MTGNDPKKDVVDNAASAAPSTPQSSPYGDIGNIDLKKKQQEMYHHHTPPVYTVPDTPPPVVDSPDIRKYRSPTPRLGKKKLKGKKKS